MYFTLKKKTKTKKRLRLSFCFGVQQNTGHSQNMVTNMIQDSWRNGLTIKKYILLKKNKGNT